MFFSSLFFLDMVSYIYIYMPERSFLIRKVLKKLGAHNQPRESVGSKGLLGSLKKKNVWLKKSLPIHRPGPRLGLVFFLRHFAYREFSSFPHSVWMKRQSLLFNIRHLSKACDMTWICSKCPSLQKKRKHSRSHKKNLHKKTTHTHTQKTQNNAKKETPKTQKKHYKKQISAVSASKPRCSAPSLFSASHWLMFRMVAFAFWGGTFWYLFLVHLLCFVCFYVC